MGKIVLTVCVVMVSVILVVSAAPAETSEDVVYSTTEKSTPLAPEITIAEPTANIPETTTAETEPPETILYYNVNLSEYVQDVIFAKCEKYNIPPEIVIAMIERESQFKQYAIGDDGRSFGLMQIQPKHHLQRMIDLGCTDLFDPVQNVTVGIDILAEQYIKYGDIAKALVAYNGGSYKGTITNYAKTVIARANEL